MKKKLFLLLLFPWAISAQQDAYMSLYQFNMPLINPAYAGAEGKHVLSLTNRNQWSSAEDSPKTTALSYSSAVGKNVGLGISVVSDKVFIEKQTMLTIDFSYKLKLNDDGVVFLGIKAGGNSYSANSDPLSTFTQIPDPAKKSLSRFNPNMGVGFLLKMGQIWFSGSMPRLFNPKRDDDIEIQSRDRIHTYLSAGVMFLFNDKFTLKPNLMYRNTKGIGAVTDLGVKGAYMNRFELGLSIRTGSIFSIQALVKINEGFSLGYAYDTYGDNQLSGLNLKAHEVAIRFKFGNSSKVLVVEEPTLQ